MFGCNDNKIPTGTAVTVSIRAYVDADGSGDYSTGDVAISGQITLTPVGGGSEHQATIGSDGTATFDHVGPGSYSASLSATPPAGAELASAPTPTVVVPFRGGAVSSEFRYVLRPGTITGVLYRDNNANNTYDAGTDTPAPGMTVRLFATSDTTQAPLAATSTGNGGAFTFATLRPGTYTVVITPIPTINIVGGTVREVTVGADATQSVAVQFTGNLLTTVADARSKAVGTTVAFVAVATQNAGLLANNNLYVQDATAGVLAFGSPTAGILAGDTVRIIGAISVFGGEVEVAAPSGGSLSVTKLGHGPVPAAKPISIADLTSGAFAGQLVSVQGATVLSTATTGATSYNVNLQGKNASEAFQVRVGNTNNIDIQIAYWQVGHAYNITGLNGVFNGTAQLKPRSSADVAVGTVAISIAQARTHAAGDTVEVEGVVYAGTGTYQAPTSTNLSAYIVDPTGGAQIFNIPTATVLVPGDSIRVTGVVSFFNAEYEIARFNASTPPLIEKLGKTTPPGPRTVTGPDLASRMYDGQFVRLSGLTVNSVGTPSGSGAYNVLTTAPDGTNLTVRIDNAAVGITNTFWQVGMSYDVSGAALNFSTNGTTFTPEIKPRSPADVVSTNVNLQTIAAARTVQNDTVTVEGIVTAGQGTFRTDNSYIQDATGGVQIFNLPAALGLKAGDAVRVHGKMTTFSNEKEITNNVTPTDSIKVTKLGSGAPPAPRVVTGAEFLARTYEGQLVTIRDVTVNTVGTPGGTGTYSVTVTAPDASPFTVFMSAPTGNVPPPASLFTVGMQYDITGIAVPFGTPSAAELKPRGASDVVQK
jgi:DNA/RNA endonuclease YhcR with UshA esterase domain